MVRTLRSEQVSNSPPQRLSNTSSKLAAQSALNIAGWSVTNIYDQYRPLDTVTRAPLSQGSFWPRCLFCLWRTFFCAVDDEMQVPEDEGNSETRSEN